MNATKVSLNAGELSDEMAGRIDLQKVQMGLERAENVRVLRVGGVTRRAGFGYVAPVYDEDVVSRLQGFRFAEEQGYVLEFSHLKMRVLRDGELLESGGAPLVYNTPWTEDQVFALQFAQRIDRIIVTHGEVPVHTITREADGTWNIEEFPWQKRVWEVATEEQVSLTPAATTGSTTITADSPIFDSTWIGHRIRLAYVRPERPTKKTVGDVVSTATALNLSGGTYTAGQVVYLASPPYARAGGKYAGIAPAGNRSFFTLLQDWNGAVDHVPGDDLPEDYPAFFMQGAIAVPSGEVSGDWSFETFGTWAGTYAVERSYNNGVSWDSVKVVASNSDRNELVQDSEPAESGADFRVLILDFNSSHFSIRFAFTASSITVHGVALITDVNSTTNVDVSVEVDFEGTTATTNWEEEAFGPKNGYPKTCTFHQKRLFLGGSRSRPQTVWASRIRSPFDFTIGTLADDGMSFETEATEYESILWISSHLSLLVGSTSGIYAIIAPNGMSVTPENNAIVRQVRHGGFDGIPAVPLQNNVLFLQTKGRKIHELTGGSIEYGGYLDVDLTQLASHITRGGVTQMAGGEVPDASLYVVSGGELALLTYERPQNVVGWARWVTDGEIESVATCPGSGEDDEIYIVVKRGDRRLIERIVPDMLRKEEDGDMDHLVFLDSSVTKTSETAFTEVEGLDHLEGREVQAFGDGEKIGSYTVVTGKVELSKEFNTVTVGLPYTSLVRTMPLDQGTIGNKSAITEMTIRFRNSLGMEISQDEANWATVHIEQPRITANEPLRLITGDAQSNLHSTWKRQPTISIRQVDPLPMTILAIRIRGRTSN